MCRATKQILDGVTESYENALVMSISWLTGMAHGRHPQSTGMAHGRHPQSTGVTVKGFMTVDSRNAWTIG